MLHTLYHSIISSTVWNLFPFNGDFSFEKPQNCRSFSVTIPPHCPPPIRQLLQTILLLGRRSTSGSDRGIAHFFMATRNTIKRVGGKRTNEQYAWVNSKCMKRSYVKLCIPLCICRLTLAWISSKISTKLQGMPTHPYRSSLTALDHISSKWSLRYPVSTGHSGHPSPTAFSQYLRPTPLAFPYPLPVMSRSRAQAFIWFRAKTD